MTAVLDSYSLDWLAARQRPGSLQRAVVEQLAEGVTVQRVREALELLRGDPLFGDVASSLGGFHIETLVAACLPGLPLTNLDVRGMTSRHLMDLRGDLWLRVSDAPFGVEVVVCTLRGAHALRDLGREGRAPITVRRALPADPEDAPAIERLLSELDFDGLQSLLVPVDRVELAAFAISWAPSLASYVGPLTVEIAEALATGSVRRIGLDWDPPELLAAARRRGRGQRSRPTRRGAVASLPRGVVRRASRESGTLGHRLAST